jgi:hypothetical protein
VVFTLPHELNALCQRNVRILYSLLFSASAAAMLELTANPTWLVGVLLAGFVPVLINDFGECADLYGVSDPIFATLGYVNNYTSAKLQIGELGLLVVPGQVCLIVQLHVDIAFSRLDR